MVLSRNLLSRAVVQSIFSTSTQSLHRLNQLLVASPSAASIKALPPSSPRKPLPSSTSLHLSATMSTITSAHAHTNNLIHATSPYLLQHAHNPVNWHVWSQDTLDLAKRENKMIFLSSGYSACHWCHVMAHESFEDEKIAAELNDNFVCVKIDREERPDIDAAYMSFIQATSGRGGWPMSVFLTPDALPLFGGTYFPPPMFTDLIERLATLWTTDRERCLESAKDITLQLRQVTQSGISGTDWDDLPPLSSTVGKAIKHWLVEFDEKDGGFGSAPKFPSPPNTFHLLHSIVADAHNPALAEAGIGAEATRKALEASAFTLLRIARGGITDHLAGGIARYSVDEEWRVPHFEKMLYDQAQLLSAYAEAIQLCETSESDALKTYVPEFENVLRGIVEYLQRYMCSPDGSLYAAEDADSLPSADDKHAKEGAFYVWDAKEIEDIVRGVGGTDDTAYRILTQHFGLKLDGNIPSSSDPHGELVGKNMLHASLSWSETAAKVQMDEHEVRKIWDECRGKLLAVRQRRPRPMRDDKIITAWNALAISGLAKTAQVLAGRPDYHDVADMAMMMAKRAADFLWRTMWDGQAHRFLRSYRNSVRGPLGFDVDHAFFVQAMLDLYAVTFDGTFVERAIEAQAAQDALFWDNDGAGGYLISSADGDGNVWARQRGDQDGAEPTSTSVSAHNLLRISALVGDVDKRIAALCESRHKRAPPALSCRDRAARSIGSGSLILNRAPFALGMLVTALLRARLGPVQCIIVGASRAAETQALLHGAQQRSYAPRTAVILIDVSSDGTIEAAARARIGDALAEGNEAVRSVMQDAALLKRAASHPFAMVCQDFTCGLPVTDPDQLLAQLRGQ